MNLSLFIPKIMHSYKHSNQLGINSVNCELGLCIRIVSDMSCT